MPISIQYKTVELPAPFPILERFERVTVHYEWTGTDALVLVMDYPNAKVGDYDDFVEHFNKWNGKCLLSAAQGLDFCKAKYSTTGRLPWQK